MNHAASFGSMSFRKFFKFVPTQLQAQLEYQTVYGRASKGDYYGCAFRVLAVFRQLCTQWSKV